jgi:DNA-binding transcriptional MerR regulator
MEERMRIRIAEAARPMTITAAAIAARVSVSTLKNLERSGVISPARDSAGRRLFIERDLEKVRQYYDEKRKK